MIKRIVLEYTLGIYKGLRQILGTDDQLKEKFNTADLPSFVGDVQLLTHKSGCSLIRVKPRYILYRELILPTAQPDKTFHPNQL